MSSVTTPPSITPFFIGIYCNSCGLVVTAVNLSERIKGEPGTGIYLTLRRAGEEEKSLLRQAAEKGQIKPSNVAGNQSQSNLKDVQGDGSDIRPSTDNPFGSPQLAQKPFGANDGAARGFDVYASPGVVTPSVKVSDVVDGQSSRSRAGMGISVAEVGGKAFDQLLSDEEASDHRLVELLNENKSLRTARDEAYAYANQLEQVILIF